MIQTFCIFDKILSAQIIFTVRILGYILNRFKTLKYFMKALKYFMLCDIALVRQLECSEVIEQ